MVFCVAGKMVFVCQLITNIILFFWLLKTFNIKEDIGLVKENSNSINRSYLVKGCSFLSFRLFDGKMYK
jgi:hypothetical protein